LSTFNEIRGELV